MSVLKNESKVLLPLWLLEKENHVSEDIFFEEARKYLTRYPGYKLLFVKNGFAECMRMEEGECS
ncbi:hypothetical protein [Cytobacillus firmus]|uniref:Uncharacterized protein n=1 Tax=Cytobacillus firmus DS1 TaxID=1307436 RepID=W7KRW8_CYTFI|nr:hypothetical protein [Cytobacillus firmus]EWG08868.1 hypothetical protein PBF_21928 [Cytobacillus firmus DS1]